MIKSLKEEFPESVIYLLDNLKQVNFSLNQESIDDKVFSTSRQGDYGLANISLKSLIKIRRLRFDKVIVPHKQFGIQGFDNVILLLYLLNTKNWLHCSIDWKLKEISRLYIIKTFFFSIIALPVFVILSIVALFLFLYLYAAQRA
jgi:hypothetical protein